MRFSVIIPVYKVEGYLNACLESVIKQTFSEFEVILVDDGSPDSSGRICDHWAQGDTRVRVFHQANRGLAGARNTGIQEAKGEYLLFLDGDDYWNSADVLASLNQILIRKPETELIICAYIKHNLMQNSWKEMTVSYKNRNVSIQQDLICNGTFYNSACCKVVKHNILRENSLFFNEGRLCEDLDWSCKLLRTVKHMAAAPFPLFVYQTNRTGSITTNPSEKAFLDAYVQMTADLEKIEALPNIECRQLCYSYWAYQYSWMLSEPGRTGYGIKKGYEMMKPYQWILKYAADSKSQKVKLMAGVIGLKNTMWFLTKYLH